MNPFDYVNAVNYTKADIMVDDLAEKDYVPFMVNRSLSYFNDTVLIANEMNVHHNIDHRLQFDFCINMIRKRKRFSKWHKASSSKDIDLLKNAYGYNNARAEEALNILNKDQLSILKDRMNQGGKQ
tara:strand:+ start:7836 stop:8213 length:378 start_codon:yes stop_codon:yes gene_type:complete